MGGLQRILKQVGGMIVQGEDGKNVVWLWDYVNDKPRLKSEMTKEEIKASKALQEKSLAANEPAE